MQWHMHRDIALNGCEYMVGKSTLHLVFDWEGSVNGTTSNRVAWLNKMVNKNMCRVSARRDRSPPGVKTPPIMVRHSPQW